MVYYALHMDNTFIFIDLETVSPIVPDRSAKHIGLYVLEAAAIVMNHDLSVEQERFHWIQSISTEYFKLIQDKLDIHVDPYALDMHAKNGLLDEIHNRWLNNERSDCLATSLYGFLLKYNIDGNKPILAGRNVEAFDKRVLRSVMGSDEYKLNLDDVVHYRTLDVTTVDLLKPRKNKNKKSSHRAMEDLERDIKILKKARKALHT